MNNTGRGVIGTILFIIVIGLRLARLTNWGSGGGGAAPDRGADVRRSAPDDAMETQRRIEEVQAEERQHMADAQAMAQRQNQEIAQRQAQEMAQQQADALARQQAQQQAQQRMVAMNPPRPPMGMNPPGAITPPAERPIEAALRRAETGTDMERLSAVRMLLAMTPDPADVPRVKDALMKNAWVNDSALWNEMQVALTKLLTSADGPAVAARLGSADPVEGRVRLAMLLVGLDLQQATSGLSNVENDTVFLQKFTVPLKGLGEAGEDVVLTLMKNPGLRVEATMCLVLDAIGTSKSLPALNEAMRISQPGPAGTALKTNATKAVADITLRRGAEMKAHPEERDAAVKALAAAGVTVDPKATPDQILQLMAKLEQAKEVMAAGFKVDLTKTSMAQLLEMQSRMDLMKQINTMLGTRYLAVDYSLSDLRMMRDKAPLVKELAAMGVTVNINAKTLQDLQTLRDQTQLLSELKKYGVTGDLTGKSNPELKIMLDAAVAKAKAKG